MRRTHACLLMGLLAGLACKREPQITLPTGTYPDPGSPVMVGGGDTRPREPTRIAPRTGEQPRGGQRPSPP
jgi:hypothetical protein